MTATLSAKAVVWLLVATFSDAADDSTGGTPDKPPPEYPIPSNCNFVAASTTSPHLRNFNKGYGHYFCRPQGTPAGRLFLFLPGTGTNDYTSIVKTAASVGMHAMSLDWDNHPCAAAACQMKLKPPIVLNASIANCTFHLQMSRLVGSSDIPVTVVANESITGRAAALVEFLAQNEPQGNGWGQFILKAPAHGTKLNWPKTTIMGHSRGASYPPLATRLFPAERAIMTGGDGDVDELEFLGWSRLPSLTGDENLYSLNPIYTAGFDKAGLSPQYKHFLGMKGNATFDRNDLAGDPASNASDTVIAKKFGGARAIWDAGVCNETQSHHLTNKDPPSSTARTFQALGNLRNYTPPCQHSLSLDVRSNDAAFLVPIEHSVSVVEARANEQDRKGYPKPTIQPSCCNRNCQANCKNCLQADGTCTFC